MNKKILFLALLLVVLVPTALVFAQDDAGGGGGTLTNMAEKVKTALQTIGLSIVIIGWIVTGILYLLSGGSPDKMGTAKKALIACVIGTVLIVLAQGAGQIMDIIKEALGIKGGGAKKLF